MGLRLGSHHKKSKCSGEWTGVTGERNQEGCAGGAEKKELGRAITHDFGKAGNERDRISVCSVAATASAASCRGSRTPLYLFVGELRIKGCIADFLGSDGESESGLGRQLGGRFTATVPGRL